MIKCPFCESFLELRGDDYGYCTICGNTWHLPDVKLYWENGGRGERNRIEKMTAVQLYAYKVVFGLVPRNKPQQVVVCSGDTYVCPICDREFIRKVDCKAHLRECWRSVTRYLPIFRQDYKPLATILRNRGQKC